MESGVPTGARDHTGSITSFDRSESEHPTFAPRALRNYSTGCARKNSQASPVM
ncbi:hypothetical protein NG2371_00334 [Nocardia gamkensis]|nr:hypothetical protein [Nocardia gamkensis]